MVSKKKIQMMTKAEGYRQKSYREDSFAERFYKNDYIGMERIKSKIWFTIFYALYLLFILVKTFWVEGGDMLHFDYQGFVIKALVWYLIFSLIISGVSSLICSKRYDQAKKRIDAYHDTVDQIIKME